jgi:3-dehydroquinate dehydratase / shikimate dehydrogenase
MICISIAQASRTLALADMLNAAQMGADLLEVRLDCFEKAPHLSELTDAKRKPLLFSCRRPQDGGVWQGSEEERQMLLRQAILSKADYVEIELDIADQIRPFPPCRRVISYTNLKETPADVADIYAEMQRKQPDIIKLTCRARTPEEAWPLVQILAKAPVPTVVVGLGRPGVMLAILGRKIGAPWTTASLERGAEAYPGQPTVRDLEDVYHYRDIGKTTRFVGVTGLGEREFLTTGLMNAAFAQLVLPHRVLPMQVGNLKLFRKVADVVKLQGVTLEEELYEKAHEAAFLDETAKFPMQAADLLLPDAEHGWRGSNALRHAAVSALEATLREREPDGMGSLHGKMVLFAGAWPPARMLAPGLKERGTSLIFASKDRAAAQRLAQIFGGRQIAWEAIYSTHHDVLVVGRDGAPAEGTEVQEEELPIHPGYLRAGMTILDLTSVPQQSRFLGEARQRGCGVVEPARLLVEQVREHVRRVAEQEVGAEALQEKLAGWLGEEEVGT